MTTPQMSVSHLVLAIEGLWVGYGERMVVRGVDVAIKPGEFVCLIGPNGSGKSTLLKAASGVLPIKQGNVQIASKDLKSLTPLERARMVAVVTQSPVMPEVFSALDLVLWGRTPYLTFLGQEGQNDFAIAKWAMEATDTWAYADRRVSEVSGGERQRLAVARALAQQAPLLLLDEPTTHLDLRHQAGLFELLRSLLAQGAVHGVLAVVHDLTLAARYADRLVLLDDGIVAADGLSADVLTAERIQDVYGAAVSIVRHPITGTPAVLPGGSPNT